MSPLSSADPTLDALLDELPALKKMLDDEACEHVVITATGRWNVLLHGTWRRQALELPQASLERLRAHLTRSPAHQRNARWQLQQLASAAGDAHLALSRIPTSRELAPAAPLDEALMQAILRGESGVIFGPSSAPKESLLLTLSQQLPYEPIPYLSVMPPSATQPRHLLLTPPLDATARQVLRPTLRHAEAAFWEGISSREELGELFGQPGSARRWASFDALDPHQALDYLLDVLGELTRSGVQNLLWLEAPHHTDTPPILLRLERGQWQSEAPGSLAESLLATANRAQRPSGTSSASSTPLSVSPSATSAPNLNELRVTQVVDTSHTPDFNVTLEQDEVRRDPELSQDMDRSIFNDLLREPLHSDSRHMLFATHSGFNTLNDEPPSEPSLEQEDSAPTLVPEHAHTEPPRYAPALDIHSHHTSPALTSLPAEAFPPSDAADLTIETNELSHELRAALARDLERQHELEAAHHPEPSEEPIDDDPEIIEVASDMNLHTRAPADATLEDLHELDTNEVARPYDALKRMERDLMIASHDEPTGLHTDFLDSPGEEQISTSVKPSYEAAPLPPEVFSSIQDEPALAPQRPVAPPGIWQHAEPDEPTQITHEHHNFAPHPDDPPTQSLSWGDDENTMQRDQVDATLEDHSPTGSTSVKLSALSERLKALRQQRQRLSGQFDAVSRDDDDLDDLMLLDDLDAPDGHG